MYALLLVKRFLLILIGITLVFEARCEEVPKLDNPTTVGLHLGSFHSATGYNDFNPGIYIELPNHITAGHYYNSNYRDSTYLGYTYAYNSRIDFTLGLTTGYQIYKYTPLLVPTYKFFNIVEDFNLRVAFIPRFFGVVQANVLHAMLEKSF